MTPSCQRCPPEEGVLAEFRIRHWDVDTKKTYRFWYVCGLHLQEDFGPWLKKRR